MTQVKWQDTDVSTGNKEQYLGTIEHIDGDYMFVIDQKGKFHKVFYQELTFVGRV